MKGLETLTAIEEQRKGSEMLDGSGETAFVCVCEFTRECDLLTLCSSFFLPNWSFSQLLNKS